MADNLADALESGSSSSQIVQKLKDAANDCLKPVIILPGSGNSVKFSVVVDKVACFVHLFMQQATEKYIIGCKSSACSVQRGSRKLIASFAKCPDLCPHLLVVKSNQSLWDDFVSQPAICELKQVLTQADTANDVDDSEDEDEEADDFAAPIDDGMDSGIETKVSFINVFILEPKAAQILWLLSQPLCSWLTPGSLCL